MKILLAVSSSAFTFLLLLVSVVQGNVLKCATGKEFHNGLIEEYASKAQYSLQRSSHPLGPDGEKCKAYQFDIPRKSSRDTDYYLVQVCGGMEGHRLYEWYNFKWAQCE
ncbi:BgTH12-01395 [Blumeria graminis f. sp. triticale]|uniref:Bgt-51799 n=2 Tax=Blumeria graminis TaxID=34373 RepID=A0A9X9MEF3_BLUGR|nr:BgTH12-01395 [Blumeria graminis f. sp. triticale]VDB83541.1 Bgt-51799 [Blumeria graminis f. sp. tritici]